MSRNVRTGAGFARPENALKRADELENVGQKQSALQALHDIITNKKHRTWSKTYESIMFKHMDLCVEMKKRNYAKEALMQYRNMCQAVNINSLEEVIKYFLKKATEKAEEAQAKAAAVTIDVEDLEEAVAPEEIMLSYVSGEKSKDRTDRELVMPWFRFLWECYRSVLEILRTNPKLEPLYAMTANKAFGFCQHYKRSAEFRRLCDMLRQHLTNLSNRYRESRESQPDHLALHMETRFEQLKVACELELWGEAFRSVEDIQTLITLSKKAPKQQMMATYYARLTQIFAVHLNHLYHAYSWLKLFSFSKAYNKGLTASDTQHMACCVLLATLSILPYDREDKKDDMAQEQEKERVMRMANILGFQVDSKKDAKGVLSRNALLASLSAHKILDLVPVEVRAIYDVLTSEYNPLELCTKLAPHFEKLATLAPTMSAASPVKDVSLTKYSTALKQVAVLRLLKQLSEAYSTMKISNLAALIPFASFSEIEAIIVDAVKYQYLQVRIDHRNSTLNFGVHSLESDRVRNHLSILAKRLGKAAHMVAPRAEDPEKQAKRVHAIQTAVENMEKEHKYAVARKALIEKRKEEQELAMLEAEKQEEARRLQAAREVELAEERRRKEDALRREKERLERELEERELAEAKFLLEAAKKKPGKFKEGEKLDKKMLIEEVMLERRKEQQEMERKMTKMAKQMDHLERARREEEIPFLEAAYQSRMDEDRTYHEEAQAQFLTTHRAAWETDVVEKRRLFTMLDEKLEFQEQVMSRRRGEFEALKRERERQIAERKRQRKFERDIARRKEFVRRCRAQVEMRVAAIEDEMRQAEAAKKQAEEEERRRKLDELAQRQREREEEIERRRLEERASVSSAAPASSAGKFVPRHLRTQTEASPGASTAPAPAAPPAEGWRNEPREREQPKPESPAPAAPAPAAAPASSGGKFVPSALRKQGGSGEAPPPGPSGSYRPPNRR